MMKKLCLLSSVLTALALSACCTTTANETDAATAAAPAVTAAPQIVFTEDDLQDNMIRNVKNPTGQLAIKVTYTAEKKVAVFFKAQNCAFRNVWQDGLPAAAEPRTVTLYASYHPMKLDAVDFAFKSSGKLKIIDLEGAAVQRDGKSYIPAATVPFSWKKPHNRHVVIKKEVGQIKKGYILLLGDSLTDNWRGKSFDYMRKNFNVCNGGICGDRHEEVKWRINDMAQELKTNPPSVVTFMLGTNNLSMKHKPQDIADAMEQQILRIKELCPEAKIILFAIPPRGMPSRTLPIPLPNTVNPLYRDLAKKYNLPFFDMSPLLLDPKTGAIKNEMYASDKLHFSDKGYAEVITPFFAGAIRLVTSPNLPANYFSAMLEWEDYLNDRRNAAIQNLALEDMLCMETHLNDIPHFYLRLFKKLEADPKTVPTLPEEMIRQHEGEGLPIHLRKYVK